MRPPRPLTEEQKTELQGYFFHFMNPRVYQEDIDEGELTSGWAVLESKPAASDRQKAL